MPSLCLTALLPLCPPPASPAPPPLPPRPAPAALSPPGHRGLPSHAPRRPSSPHAPPSPVLLSTRPASSVSRRRGMRRARPRRPGGWCSTLPGAVSDGLKEKLHTAVLLASTPYSLASLELQASKPRTREGHPDELGVGAVVPVRDPGAGQGAPRRHRAQVVLISMAILFMLFSVQRFGADKVGYTFVPVISVWFLLIAGIEMYNLVVHDISVLRAFSPMYIVQYFIRNGKSGRVSLGEIILCVTGTTGMFADLGHFNIRVVQVVYLRKFPHNVANTFYRSIPAPMFWPAFIVAILSGIITSQAMLSRAFAILSKALSLGCMPRVRVIHTLHRYEGQVYIPEVNFLMGLASLLVTVGSWTTTSIGHAYDPWRHPYRPHKPDGPIRHRLQLPTPRLGPAPPVGAYLRPPQRNHRRVQDEGRPARRGVLLASRPAGRLLLPSTAPASKFQIRTTSPTTTILTPASSALTSCARTPRPSLLRILQHPDADGPYPESTTTCSQSRPREPALHLLLTPGRSILRSPAAPGILPCGKHQSPWPSCVGTRPCGDHMFDVHVFSSQTKAWSRKVASLAISESDKRCFVGMILQADHDWLITGWVDSWWYLYCTLSDEHPVIEYISFPRVEPPFFA
ncbi:hypothetical protein ZWY2020_005865 [Hordeum vulgare]|nr:hypothetical protein ZWY2020_005865 [Hordeum vulgare]